MLRMTRSTSWILAALLLVACAGGIYMLIGRSTAPPANVHRATEVPRSSIAPITAESPGVADKPMVSDTAAVPAKANTTTPTIRSHPGQAPPRTHLKSETVLLAEMDGRRGMNVRSIGLLLKGDGFADFMDQLAVEASASPLALDLTELYAQSANEANTTVDSALAIRVVCGMSACGLSATAPSKEVFDAWFMAFIENPSAPPHAAGRHDKVLENGTVEYRLVFSNDPQRNGAIAPPR